MNSEIVKSFQEETQKKSEQLNDSYSLIRQFKDIKEILLEIENTRKHLEKYPDTFNLKLYTGNQEKAHLYPFTYEEAGFILSITETKFTNELKAVELKIKQALEK